MAARFATVGNELYTGQRSHPFIQRSRLWFLLAALLVLASATVPLARGGFNLGIEFTGGSEFTISDTANTDVAPGEEAMDEVTDEEAVVTNIAPGTIQVRTGELDEEQTLQAADALQEAYSVGSDQVTSTYIGPVWGEHISEQMLLGLAIFLIMVTLYMALYFRTWKMSVAAIIGLGFVVATTAGIYAATDFEVTPSAIIGFLTILSYALYDTMVVFDKVRENVRGLFDQKDQTFAERVNLAVNQTLVRSLNTSVVGILPVGSILFIGAWLLGAGTLRDIALALFVGIIVGTIATLFVQAPLYGWMRGRDADVVAHAREVLQLREEREIGRVTYSGTPLDADGRVTSFPPLPEPEPDEDDEEPELQIVITGAEGFDEPRGDDGEPPAEASGPSVR
ncbi:protein translocase subunit SecF [Nesterenkonia sp. F]|uniref:protein translocase subunit SecF n=1 Tax=Nesterenkonia sp. F TaxID=795955 RepID=UPI000255C7F6|nr:protein translocase subunit SecF [Nesterenkonia sp. F]